MHFDGGVSQSEHPVHPIPSKTAKKLNAMASSDHSLSRKRSHIALVDSPSPPSSRPPSRDGNLNVDHKRSRVAKQWNGCPAHVTTADHSIRLDQRAEVAKVNVLQPGFDDLSGDGEFSSLITDGSRFTMLCFLGCIIDHLHAVSLVSSLLSTFKVNIYGVSLIPPPPQTSSLPIIYDPSRQLTSSLGLLHPLGGGRTALDAIVVLDSKLRRRMLLPIGWGVKTRVGNTGMMNPYADREEEEVTLTCEQEVERAVKRLIEGVEWMIHEEEVEYSERWDEGIRTAMVHGMDYE